MKIMQDEVPKPSALRDVTYGPHDRHRLDVYPAQRTEEPAPVVLFFHGGSWRKGDKRLYRWLGRALSRRGFMTVIPNYRLYPEAQFPVFMDDAALAVAWTRMNAARHGADPHEIHVMGHSAGAHIVTLLGLDEIYLRPAALSPGDLRSVIGMAGPYSMDPLKAENIRPIFESAPNLDRVRPINLVHRRSPPMLLLHGGRDSVVPSRQSVVFHEALTENGGEARSIIYPSIGHIELMLTLTPVYRWRAPVFRDVVTFLRDTAEARRAGLVDRVDRLFMPQADTRRASG